MYKDKISIITLILVNLIPLYGVLFDNWQIFTVVFSYWLQSLVVGMYTILKMMKDQGISESQKVTKDDNQLLMKQYSRLSNIILIPFFCLHYGGFLLGHLVFIIGLFPVKNFHITQMIIPSIALVINHGVSYWKNFIGQKEYLYIAPLEQMGTPYIRVFVMHLTVLGGAFMIVLLHLPIFALVLLVLLKTYGDYWSHIVEHKLIEQKRLPTYQKQSL